jgi:tetratricopeptide (TPR) repeat protein
MVVLAAFFACAAAGSSRDLHSTRRERNQEELMYFPSGLGLRLLGLGQSMTLADLLWLRAIQYYGEHRLTDNRFPLAGHIFETITQLDPHFAEAYLFGGLVLAAEGGDLPRGLALLRRGMAWNPWRWDLAFETGFVYYVAAKDDAQAARFFEQARRLPGASAIATRFAAHLRARTGDNEAALALWEELLRGTTHPALRDLAERKIKSIREALAKAPSSPSPAMRSTTR